MPSATIKLFLPYGDPQRLRTAEISNWSGKAVAAPRTEFDEFLVRDELLQSGVYLLTGTDHDTGAPLAYIGEAEILRDRMKDHKKLEFWIRAVAFVSKDENLTKAHIRYLEGRLIQEALSIGRFKLTNSHASGSKLPESDREDMEVFLSKIFQLLPVLGIDVVTPIVQKKPHATKTVFVCTIKGLSATGERTPNGFAVHKGSQAVLQLKPSAAVHAPYIVTLREQLIEVGDLVQEGPYYRFVRDVEFTSPSTAAGVVRGGSAAGPVQWRTQSGKTLKELEAAPSA